MSPTCNKLVTQFKFFTTVSVRVTVQGMIVLPKIISARRTFYYGLHPGSIIFRFSKRRPFSEYSTIMDIIFIPPKKLKLNQALQINN